MITWMSWRGSGASSRASMRDWWTFIRGAVTGTYFSAGNWVRSRSNTGMKLRPGSPAGSRWLVIGRQDGTPTHDHLPFSALPGICPLDGGRLVDHVAGDPHPVRYSGDADGTFP